MNRITHQGTNVTLSSPDLRRRLRRSNNRNGRNAQSLHAAPNPSKIDRSALKNVCLA